MQSKQTKSELGQQAETFAANHIEQHGLKIIERNFRCRFGEIDLIAIDKDTLVFIEVRYRKNSYYMTVAETVGHKKIQRLIAASEYYLSGHREYKNWQCRYDFIGIIGDYDSLPMDWIKNAFQT